jgi:FkbH-like protein
MIRAQVEREKQRARLSREEFLATLDLRISLECLSSVREPLFVRALELINKTNQFNTTGARWSSADASAYFDQGGAFYVLRVQDLFTDYGAVGVLCVDGSHVDQFVLSCRVIGLDVEIAAVALLAVEVGPLTATLTETPLNQPCQDTWERCGFCRDGELFRQERPVDLPLHLRRATNSNSG